jgi:tetratricopeptide (TPR) repeat protein
MIAAASAPSTDGDRTRALDRPWIILAQADQAADAAAQARYDDALRAVLANPTDVEANYAFAEAAVAVGDIQGAIGALERILLVQPDRPDIKLRLGQLYQQVGAFELAESYLGGGLESRDIPQAIREQAERLFDEAAQQRALATRRQLLQGSVFLGGGWESNANAGPPSNTIRLFGFEGPFLADEDKEESDYSASRSRISTISTISASRPGIGSRRICSCWGSATARSTGATLPWSRPSSARGSSSSPRSKEGRIRDRSRSAPSFSRAT